LAPYKGKTSAKAFAPGKVKRNQERGQVFPKKLFRPQTYKTVRFRQDTLGTVIPDISSLQPPCQSAVLFLVFNRPEVTKQVFDAIAKAMPPRLYIASDGPREDVEGEQALVDEVRSICEAITWPCEVQRLYRQENLGCKTAVSEAITWFFTREEKGIILEDDCLPSRSFFSFCDEVLERYSDSDEVMVVTGNNFQNGRKRGSSSYYFSKYSHIWGWATWRSTWEQYDSNLKFWDEWEASNDWRKKVPNPVERRFWQKIFENVSQGLVDTWDYQLLATLWFRGGLVVTPNTNLVSNIGFGANATHTTQLNSKLQSLPTGEICKVNHPDALGRNYQADRYVFGSVLCPQSSRLAYRALEVVLAVKGGAHRH